MQADQDQIYPARSRCIEPKCCNTVMSSKILDPVAKQIKEVLVPLKSVALFGQLEAGLASINVQLTYSNLISKNPIECTFEFPIEPSTVICRLFIQIDDRVVEAKVKSKNDAKQQYDDAMAGGNASVFATREIKDEIEMMTLNLGNLLPGQIAKVDIEMINPLKITNGAFEFSIPVSLLPQYKKHQAFDQNFQEKIVEPSILDMNLVSDYTLEYGFTIIGGSNSSVSFLSAPEGSKSTPLPIGFKVEMAATNFIPKKDVKIFYKTADMLEPQLKFIVDNERGEVACMASFVPTFEEKSDQAPIITDSEPEALEISKGEDFCFIFLVDRSGSMGGRRIEITKESLNLFIQSLPVGSSFAILGFGDKSEFCILTDPQKKGLQRLTYDQALQQLSDEDKQYSEELIALSKLDFKDFDRNLKLLRKFKGDINQSIDELLQNSDQNKMVEENEQQDGQTIWPYTDQTMNLIKQQIKIFEANYGGTKLLEPMIKAVSLDVGQKQKRIFLLTDGEVDNVEQIVNYIQVNNSKVRVHTFGIGDDCSKSLIEKTAIAGRGSYSFASDRTPNLSGKVVDALKKAFNMSLADCVFEWPNRKVKMHEVFRDQLVTTFEILKLEEFEQLKVKFSSAMNDLTNKPINQSFERSVFKETLMPLFQMAAHEKLQSLSDDENVKMSVKYQVLSKYTAMIGVAKQKNKVTGELVEFNINIQKSSKQKDFRKERDFQPLMYGSATQNQRQMPQSFAQPKMIFSGLCSITSSKQTNSILKQSPPSSPPSFSKKNSFAPQSFSLQNQTNSRPYPQVPTPLPWINSTQSNQSFAPQPQFCSNQMQQFGASQSVPFAPQFQLDSIQRPTFHPHPYQMNLALFNDNSQQEQSMSRNSLPAKIIQPDAAISSKAIHKKPTFTEVVSLQTSEGYWQSNASSVLKQFLKDQQKDDLKTDEITFWTLVALSVLELIFAAKEGEWQMLGQKARSYLKSKGVNVQAELKLIENLIDVE